MTTTLLEPWTANTTPSEIVGTLSAQLSDLYVLRDECWLTGADPVPLQQQIDTIERQHAAMLCSCHLCDGLTPFRDAAFGLPFCWHCLHERYDHWYRTVRYRRGGSRK